MAAERAVFAFALDVMAVASMGKGIELTRNACGATHRASQCVLAVLSNAIDESPRASMCNASEALKVRAIRSTERGGFEPPNGLTR